MNTSPLKICLQCDRRAHCLYPCDLAYNEANNIKNPKIPEIRNPYVARVTGFDNSNKTEVSMEYLKDVKVLHLNIDKFTHEKKEELRKLMGSCSGMNLSFSEMVIGNKDNKNKKCDRECLADYLEYDVSQWEYFLVMKGKKSITELIDRSSLLTYLELQNQIYCDEHELCRECRSELVEVNEYRGEHFGFGCEERILVCRNGC